MQGTHGVSRSFGVPKRHSHMAEERQKWDEYRGAIGADEVTNIGPVRWYWRLTCRIHTMQGQAKRLSLRVKMCEVSRVGSAEYECLKHQSNGVAWSVNWDED